MEVASAYGVEGVGATGTDFKGMGPVGREVTAAAGTAIMFVEVTYEYQPLLFGAWLGPRTIRSTAAYNIREARDLRSEEHTSELQSLMRISYAVVCLKKKSDQQAYTPARETGISHFVTQIPKAALSRHLHIQH